MQTRIKWVLNPAKTQIRFNVQHLISSIKGEFKTFDAVIFTDGVDFNTTEVSFWLNADTIDTGVHTHNNYVKGPEFFDSKQHQYIKFVSEQITRTDKRGIYDMYGDLIIKEICKPVKFQLEFNGMSFETAKEKVGFNLRGKINRKDWRLNWRNLSELGASLINDEINLNCDIEMLKSEMITEVREDFFPRELPLINYKKAS